MDRSFLSLAPVIQASRRFVCIRPLSYESAEEAAYLRRLFVGRAGDIENTTCAFLSADGKRLLTRPSRGLQELFRDASSLATWMNQMADEQDALNGDVKPAASETPLPVVSNVRLAINVAAADDRPLVVLRPGDLRVRLRAQKALAELAGKEEFIGRFTFVVAAGKTDLAKVEGAGTEPGLLVVQPDRFGQKGSVLARSAETADPKLLAAALREGLKKYHPNPPAGPAHVRDGQRAGVFWDTKLPVTDPLEAQARERTRQFLRPAPGPQNR